ncbi:MAG: citrate/2-methylcitrate synthase, partial [Planctomycetota bacterium]
MTAEPQMKAGLEGVIVAPTRLSLVDGIKGELIIAGFPLEELAERASFEETLALLWEDQLPGKARRDEILQALTPCRALPETTRELLPRIAATGAATMDALLMATGTLGLELPRPADAQGFAPEAVALVARIPTAI